jgi:hypothetical protein
VAEPFEPLTGRCLCGEVRFEILEPPTLAGYCHCTRCQRRSGTAASLNIHVVPGSVRITAGEELVRAYKPEGGSPKAFCSACGGALWSTTPAGEPAGVRFGVLDRDPGIPPTYRQYVAYAPPWEPIPDDGIPRFSERRQ